MWLLVVPDVRGVKPYELVPDMLELMMVQKRLIINILHNIGIGVG